MLRLLHSIFGGGSTGRYPEKLVKAAIERAVDGTDPWLRAVAGYRKKLRPAVLAAIDHVVALADGLAPPLAIDAASTDGSALRPFFISAAELHGFLAADRTLAAFTTGTGQGATTVYALLAMEREGGVSFGAVLSGDLVLQDVPLASVTFTGHRLLEPALTLAECRHQLKRRAFDHLLGLALQQLTEVKAERATLERYRALLRSKLELLRRSDWGFHCDPTGDDCPEPPQVEGQLQEIEDQLLALGGDDRMLELYLGMVAQVLAHAPEHLWARRETLLVDSLGLRRAAPADDTRELTLQLLENSAGRSLVVMLVALRLGNRSA